MRHSQGDQTRIVPPVGSPKKVMKPRGHGMASAKQASLEAETVGVKIVDHLIVSASESFSFRKAGLL